jgi:hypothetical protein
MSRLACTEDYFIGPPELIKPYGQLNRFSKVVVLRR